MKYSASLIFLCVSVFLSGPGIHAAVLVNRGAPAAEIIVAADAPETERLAAAELQYWLGAVTGALLPVVHQPSPEHKNRIFIGRAFAGDYRNDLDAIGSTDGFAMRSKGRNIFIFGAIPRGTLNGVYAFLEKNTDIIWPRPNWALGAVYTVSDTLKAGYLDSREIPKSTLRGWGWTIKSQIHESGWESRNRCNWLGYYSPDFIRKGTAYSPAGGGHGLKKFIPHDKYFAEHPEYYPFIDGKRVTRGQLCFLAYGMIPEYVKNLRAELDAKPGSDGVNISTVDGYGLCECPLCVKPFRTENGKTVSLNDSAFRSAQYYAFLNKVAREIARSHPHVTLLTYAYTFTVNPPPFKLEPNIRVMYCPFCKNDKYSIADETNNKRYRDWLVYWGGATDKTWFREYYGCAGKFPRPLEDVVKTDLQFCLENNIREFHSELPVDQGDSMAVWDVSAMTMWVITRLWWDPAQDVDRLRGEYLQRTYREAAAPMARYYGLIRKSWYASSFPSLYSDGATGMARRYIKDAGIEDDCRAALLEAEKLAAHPISRELVRRQVAAFEGWMEYLKNDKTVRLNIPFLPVNLSTDFDAKAWERAAATEPFVLCRADGVKQPGMQSEARLLHDRKNLYILLTAHNKDAKTLKGGEIRQGQSESFPDNDHFELFLGSPESGVYYHFALDIGNAAVYDGKGYDGGWDSNWKRTVRRLDNRWQAIVTIPLADIDCNVTVNNKLMCLVYRCRKFEDGSINKKTGRPNIRQERSSWGGGYVHETAAFGEITLEQFER